MAFSVAWDEDAPDGAVITVSLLDNYIRQTRVAVRERMEGDPSNPLTGIVEPGTWDDAPVLKAGSGRFAFGLEADVGDETEQNGRGYFTTDAGASHPKLYHLDEDGAIEVAYLNLDGSRPLAGPLTVTETKASATSAQTGISVQTVQSDGAYTVTNVYGIRIQQNTKGSGVTVTNQYGLKIENIDDGGSSNYAIHTGTGLVQLGGAVTIANQVAAALTLEGTSGVDWMQITQTAGDSKFGASSGEAFVRSEVAVKLQIDDGGGIETALTVTAGRSVAAGQGGTSSGLATNATTGFFYIPHMNGAASGVPEAITGYSAMVFDYDNNRLRIYDAPDAGWLDVAMA